MQEALLRRSWGYYQRVCNAQQREINFIPRADVFATTSEYTIHVSVPGARKENISVTYDPERAELQISGVVLRQGVDEKAYSALVVDERGEEEIGIFEREIRLLHAAADAASVATSVVDVNGISAWLADGILIITLRRVATLPGPEKVTVPVRDGVPDSHLDPPADHLEVNGDFAVDVEK